VETLLLLIHALVTIFMTGLIWFVQVVHYPLMAMVGESGFTEYEAKHMDRTSRVVGPAMLIEVLAAAALAASPPEGRQSLVWIGVALLAVIWFSTAALQVPRHRALRERFDEKAIRSLVSTNWVRTACWSARSVIALLLLAPGASA